MVIQMDMQGGLNEAISPPHMEQEKTMKCVKGNGKVVRVTNDKAEKLVAEKGYKYATKQEWKAAGRELA